MKTIDIKGKPYVEVHERIKQFRSNEKYQGCSLITTILKLEDGICLMKAEIVDEGGNILAIGHAYEKEGSTFINKTSYIENCETSAWGRALANLGIGIDHSITSGDEVQNAIKQQEIEKQKDILKKEVLDVLKSSTLEEGKKHIIIDEIDTYSIDKLKACKSKLLKLKN